MVERAGRIRRTAGSRAGVAIATSWGPQIRKRGVRCSRTLTVTIAVKVSSLEHAVEDVRRPALSFGDTLGIQVGRETDLAMSELLLHLMKFNTSSDHECGRSVTQLVKA